jgi:hypothetical protein
MQLQQLFCTHKTNVEEYNNIFLHKKFSIIKIYQLKINTNATNIKHIEPWFNEKSFTHINKIVIVVLIIFTRNVNIPKGSINGAITTIISIIYDPQNNVIAIEV